MSAKLLRGGTDARFLVRTEALPSTRGSSSLERMQECTKDCEPDNRGVYSFVAEKAKWKFVLNLALIHVNSGDTREAHDILDEYLLTQRDSPDV